jgi:hypothetical protein
MSITRQHTEMAASHTHQSKSDANPFQQANARCFSAKAATNGAKRQTMTTLPCEPGDLISGNQSQQPLCRKQSLQPGPVSGKIWIN